MYVTPYKNKGKVSNNNKQFHDCLMTRIVHTPSPETVSKQLDMYQNKVSPEKG